MFEVVFEAKGKYLDHDLYQAIVAMLEKLQSDPTTRLASFEVENDTPVYKSPFKNGK